MTIVRSGTAAIEEATKHKFEAFIMDIHLGLGIDGIEVTRQIRNIPEYKDTPIIAVTAYAMSGDREKFIDVGMTHYISKPINVNEFHALIKKILKKLDF